MPPFFVSLPEGLWPEVNRRLHFLPALWEMAQRPDIAAAFLNLGPDLELWRPGPLGLAALSVLEPAAATDPIQWLRGGGRGKLAQAYNALVAIEAQPATGSGDRPGFVQATIAGVALQQRFAATHDLAGVARDAARSPGSWSMPLICLYGLLDDPAQLVSALLNEACGPLLSVPNLIEAVGQMLVANETKTAVAAALPGFVAGRPAVSRLVLARFFAGNGFHDLARVAAAGDGASPDLGISALGAKSPSPYDLPTLYRALSDALEGVFLSEYGDGDASQTRLGRLVEAAQSLNAEMALHLGQRALAQNDAISALAAFQEAQGLRPYDRQLHALVAEAAALRGDEHTAQIALGQMARSKNPPAAQLAAARAERHLGNLDRAKELVRQLVVHDTADAQDTDRLEPNHWTAAAELLSLLADHAAAFSAWQAVAAALPTNAQAYVAVARHALELGRTADALEFAWQAVGLDPTEPLARQTLAAAMSANGDASGALQQRRRIVELDTRPVTRLQLAEAALAAADYKLAFDTADALLGDPDSESLNISGLPFIVAGRALTAQGQAETAFDYFNKAIALAPASVESWRAVAAHHKLGGDPQRALAALDAGRHLIDQESPEAAGFFADLGELRADLHHLTEATGAFEKAVQLKPNRVDLLMRLGELYRLQNKLPDAIEAIGRAAATSAKDPALFHRLGQLYESAGRFPDALSAYRQAHTMGGASHQLFRDLGRLAYQLREVSVARPVFERLLTGRDRFEPADLDSLILLGAIYEQSGDFGPALAVYKHAIALEPLRSDLCVRLGMCCLELGQPETALAALKDAAERDLDNLQLQKVMGQAYAAAHLWSEAVLAYGQAGRVAPDDHRLLESLAQAARRAGDPDRAADALRRAIALAPDSVAYRQGLGELLMGENQAAEAKSLYAESCRIIPEAVELWMGLGQTQVMLNEISAAAKSFEKAAALRPEAADVLSAVGETQALLGHYETAHAAFARAAEVEPANPVPLRRAGECMWELGREAMAMALWRKVLVTHPEDTTARARLGSALGKQGQFAEALAELDLAAQTAPHNAPIAIEAARVAIQTGEVDRAIAHLERAAQAKADDAEVWQLLSRAFQAKGQLDQALTAIRRAIRLAPGSGSAQAAVAQLLAEGGNLAEALTAADAALKTSPDDPIVLAAVGQVFIQAGHYSEAVAVTGKVAAICPNNGSAHLAYARAQVLDLGSGLWDMGAADPIEPPIQAAKPKIMQSLERAAALAADEIEVKEWAGRARVLFGEAAEALPLLEATAAARPTDDVLRVLSACYRRLGSLQLARRASLAALDRAPDSVASVIELGLVCAAQADKTGARAAFQRAIGLDIHCAPAYQLLADTMISLGERAEAITIYNQALGLDSGHAAWHYRLAELYEGARDSASALAHYQRAASLAVEQHVPGRETAGYLAAVARAHARDNDLDAARREFEAALALRDDVAAWWSQCARLNFELKNYQRAFDEFTRACELQPTDTAAFMGAARAALALGQAEEAEENAISVLRQNPDNYDALIVMGEVFEGRGDLKNALLAFTRAAERTAQPLPALRAQARLLQTLQRPAEALAILKHLTELTPEDDEAWAGWSEAQAEDGHSAEAIPLLLRAIQIAPRKAKHYVALGRLYRQIGQLDAALAQLQQACDLNPPNLAALREMAQVFEGRRQFSRAYEIYQQLMAFEPDNSDHFFRAGLALKEMRDYLDALALFQQAVKLDPQNAEAQHQRAAVAAFGILKGKK